MNDEIVVRFNGDLSPLASSLRGLKGMVDNVKKEFSMSSIVGGLTGGLAALGVGFSAGKLVESARSSMELAEHIKVLSDNLGVSTDFFQQWSIAAQHAGSDSEHAQKGIEHIIETVGKARSGNDEAIQLLKKWGIALEDAGGKALSNQDVFEEVSKKLLSIDDPAVRAAAALDLLGKKGEQLVAALKELQQVKGNKGFILDEHELAILDAANHKVETLWQRVKTLTAKGWSTAMTPFVEADAMRDEVLNRKSATGTDVSPESIQQAKEMAKAMADVAKATLDKQYAQADAQGKYRKTLVEVAAAEEKLKSTRAGSVENLQAQSELLRAQTESITAKAAAEKESQDKQKKADEDHKKHLKEEQDLNKKIAEDRQRIASIRDSMSTMNAQYGTLQEVANSGYSYFQGNQWKWHQGPLAGMAQQSEMLDARAHRERIWGNRSGAESDEAQSSKIKQALEASGAIAPTMTEHLKSISEDMAKQRADISDLTTQAKTDGIIVKGSDHE